MKIASSIRSGFLLTPLLGLLPACSADVITDSSQPADEGADTASVHEALFESTCWTQTAPDRTFAAGPGLPLDTWDGHFYYETSPDGSYDHATCPTQWITEVTNLHGKSFYPYGRPADLRSAPDESFCAGYWVNTKVKGWRPYACPTPTTCGGVWEDVMTQSALGSWWFGGCVVRVFGQPFLPTNHPYTKVRIVTEAGWVWWRTRVEAGVIVAP